MVKNYFLVILLLVTWQNFIGQETYVTGGFPIDIEDAPYQVSLQNSGDHHCGGSLIHERYILTAAHCFTGVNPSNLTVVIGLTEQTITDPSTLVVPVENIFIHNNYDSQTSENDIALIELSNTVNFNASVQSIEILTPLDEFLSLPNETARVSGWGWTIPGVPSPSDILMAADVPIISNNDANNQLDISSPNHPTVSHTMLATGFPGMEREGACHGDSGGPLITNDNNSNYLIGVVSWGVPNCIGGENSPSIYTRVSSFSEWIKSTIGIPEFTGGDSVCANGTTFNINGVVSEWSHSPNLQITFSDTNSATFVPTNTQEHTGWIKAKVNGFYLKKEVKIGVPVITAEGYYYNSSPTYPLNPYYSIPNNPVSETPATVTANFSFKGATNSDAQILSQSDPSINWGVSSGSDQLSFYFDFYGSPDPWNPQSQTIVWRVTAESSCGTETYDVAFYSEVDNYNYAYYPNPASSKITIENTSYEKSKQSFNLSSNGTKGSIVIYDFHGSVVKTEEYDLNSKSFNLDVSKLKPGKYFMKIGAAREEETHQIVIRR